MAGSNGYGLAAREPEADFTFSTGTRARLRVYPSQRALMRVAPDELQQALTLSMAGELREVRVALALEETVVCATWIEPRVVPDDQEPGPGEHRFSELSDEEIEETLVFAYQGAAEAVRFRDRPRGEAAGGGGADVAGAAEQPARAPRRKPRGVGGR